MVCFPHPVKGEGVYAFVILKEGSENGEVSDRKVVGCGEVTLCRVK